MHQADCNKLAYMLAAEMLCRYKSPSFSTTLVKRATVIALMMYVVNVHILDIASCDTANMTSVLHGAEWNGEEEDGGESGVDSGSDDELDAPDLQSRPAGEQTCLLKAGFLKQ